MDYQQVSRFILSKCAKKFTNISGQICLTVKLIFNSIHIYFYTIEFLTNSFYVWLYCPHFFLNSGWKKYSKSQLRHWTGSLLFTVLFYFSIYSLFLEKFNLLVYFVIDNKEKDLNYPLNLAQMNATCQNPLKTNERHKL